MTLTLSPPVRIVAVLGLVAALAFAGGMFALGRGADEPESVDAIPAELLPKRQEAPASAAKPAAVATAEPTAEPSVAPPARPAVPEEPEAAPVAAPNGLPTAVHAALQRNEVVVVAVFAPGSRVDDLAVPEARAGAKAAGSGFVALNALDEREGGPLARLIGIVKPPSVLVYTRPDTLFLRLEGFADAATVAQAAENAGR